MPNFLKRLLKSLARLVITFILIIMISFIPTIYEYEYQYYRIVGMDISTSNYFSSIKAYFNQLLDGELGTYTLSSNRYGLYGENPQAQRAISSEVLLYFKTTVKTFIPALTLGLIFGIFMAYVTLLMKSRWRKIPHLFSFLLVAIPDFFLVLILQFTIIYIYKKTGVKLFNVATGGSQEAVFLPIFTLSLFPFAYFYRTTLNSFEDIMANRYIQTAYAKGLKKSKVLWSHTIKNGLIISLNNLPSIVMPVISNLFIIEYMYNTHGITSLVFNHYQNTNLLVVSVFLIWLMVETVLLLNDLTLKMLTRHKGDNYAK